MADTLPQALDAATRRALREHPRQWREFRYVYPVVSRRGGGLSVGVNLNPDKICNFDCVYCCVNRHAPGSAPGADAASLQLPACVDLDVLGDELRRMLSLAVDGPGGVGPLWEQEPFAGVAGRYRQLHDIAFSGEGEPTAYPRVDEAVALAAQVKRAMGLGGVKLILITNATLLDRPAPMRAIKVLDENNGEVWAKLDVGTQAYYDRVNRSAVPLRRVLENILGCGRARPIVIQSLFLTLDGEPTPEAQVTAYVGRLRELVEGGCALRGVQVYTVARATAESFAGPLSEPALRAIADRVRAVLPGVRVDVFPGVEAA